MEKNKLLEALGQIQSQNPVKQGNEALTESIWDIFKGKNKEKSDFTENLPNKELEESDERKARRKELTEHWKKENPELAKKQQELEKNQNISSNEKLEVEKTPDTEKPIEPKVEKEPEPKAEEKPKKTEKVEENTDKLKVNFTTLAGQRFPVFDKKFLKMNKRDKGYIERKLKLNNEELNAILASNPKEWRTVKPKRSIAVNKRDTVPSGRSSVSVAAGLKDNNNPIMKPFTYGELLRKIYTPDPNKVYSYDKGILVKMQNTEPVKAAILNLNNKYIMVMETPDGGEHMVIFPINKNAFNLAFTIS